MKSSDFRAEARNRLSGKWGKAVCFILAYFLITFLFGFAEGLFPEAIQVIPSIAITIISAPLTFGFTFAFFKLYNNEEVGAFDFLSLGFNSFKRAWFVSLQTLAKLIVPIILIIVSYVIIAIGIGGAIATSVIYNNSSAFGVVGIIGFIFLIFSMIWCIVKSYYYKLAMILAIDNPEITAKEAVENSKNLMEGNRGKLFCLELSFIGWAILAILTFYIGFLWLIPYIQFTTIAFYYHLAKKTEVTENNHKNNNEDSLE